MALIDISQGFAVGEVTTITDAIDVIRQILITNMVNLTPEERKKYFKLSDGSEAFADTIMNMATNHSITVPGDITFSKVQTIFNYRNDLKLIKNNKMDVDELIDDLIMMTGILLMGYMNRIYSNAKDMAERSNYPFNELVAQAAARYLKGPKAEATVFSIAAGAEVKIFNVLQGCVFCNTGTTMLKAVAGNELSGTTKKLSDNPLGPGNTAKFPKGYHMVIVTNMSSDTEGSFSVKIES